MMRTFPVFNATQQRFQIFKQEVSKFINDNINILSAPSGLMPELECQGFNKYSGVKITALDLDAKLQNMLSDKYKGTEFHGLYNLVLEDVYNISYDNEFDLVVSNGLNIYIPGYKDVEKLYRLFYSSLNTGGKLITSFLTPPPIFDTSSPWDLKFLDDDKLKLQKNVFIDVLNITWNCYMSEKTFIKLLEDVGFCNISIIWDKCKIFPTVICYKS